MILLPTSKDIFFTKHDHEDLRYGDFSIPAKIDIKEKFPFALLGYCDDLGIHLNGGRPGAALAPDKIREFFFKMTPRYSSMEFFSFKKNSIADFGSLLASNSLDKSIEIKKSELIHNHEVALDYLEKLSLQTENLITLGAGHDYAYVDGISFLNKSLADGQRPLIINFDAHLDVRPVKEGNTHSGTPFRRLLETHKEQFDFIELGLQPQCNSSHHWKWAHDQGAHLFSIEDMRSSYFAADFTDLLKKFEDNPCFLSIDIDVFDVSQAPGCSQAWPLGLSYSEFRPLMDFIMNSLNVIHLGVYEVSPVLDQDNRTSKLAALILHHYVESQIESKYSE